MDVSSSGECRLSCSQCAFTTSARNRLEKHQEKHAGKQKFTCSQCLYTTNNRIEFEDHQGKHAGDPGDDLFPPVPGTQLSTSPTASGSSGDNDADNPRNSGGTAVSRDESDSSSEKTPDNARKFDNSLEFDQEDGSVTSETGSKNPATSAEETERCPERETEVGPTLSSKVSKLSIRNVNSQGCSLNQDSQDNVKAHKIYYRKPFRDRECPSDNPTDNHSADTSAAADAGSEVGNGIDNKQSSHQNHLAQKDKITSIQSGETSILDKPGTDYALSNGNEKKEQGTLVWDSTRGEPNCDKHAKDAKNPKSQQKTGGTGKDGSPNNSDEGDFAVEDSTSVCGQQTVAMAKNAADGGDRQDSELHSHKNINKDDVIKQMKSLGNQGNQGADQSGSDKKKKELLSQDNKTGDDTRGHTQDQTDFSSQADKTAHKDGASVEGDVDRESTSDEEVDDPMIFSIILNGKDVISVPSGEETLKWRFLFDCPHTFKELKEDSVFNNAKLSYQKGTLPCLEVKNPGKKFKTNIVEVLTKHSDGLQIYQTVIPDEAVTIFWTALHGIDLFRKMIAIAYRRGTSLYVCSRKEHMEEASRRVKITEDFALKTISKTVIISLKDIPHQLMKRWIEVHVSADTSCIHYELQEDQKSLHITGVESTIIKEKEKLQNLLERMITKTYKTRKCTTHLSFLKKPVVANYIEQILQEQKLVCSWETSKTDCCIVFTAFDEETCEKANEVIDAACMTESRPLKVDEATRILPSDSWKQEVSCICTKLGGKMKIWLDKNQNILEYVHTQDIKDKVQQNVEVLLDRWKREKYLIMDKEAVEDLQRNKQKQKNLEEKHSVTISISKNIERNTLIIQGMERNIQQAEEELKRECTAVLKPNPDVVKGTFTWENSERFCIPESNEADLILLRDSSTVLIHKNSDELKMEDPESGTEVIEIIPECTLKVGAGEITVNMVFPSDKFKRPVTFCCPEWNDGVSKEKEILDFVLGQLFKLISDLSGEALLEVKDYKIGKWQVRKFLKHMLMAYQKHLKVNERTDRIFLLVRDVKLYDIVKGVLSDQFVNNPVTKADSQLHKEDEISTGEPRVFVLTTPGSTSTKRIKVYVVKGVLAERKEDVLVNSAHHTLNLENGKVSQSILKAAGAEIQKECYRKCQNGIKPGELVITKAYNLKNSKLIFHGTFEIWKPKDQEKLKKTLKEFVTCCLQMAEKNGMKSIAFPAIGTGLLKYPCSVVADCMFEAVEEYSQTTRPGYVMEVYFVIYHVDKDTLDAFLKRGKLHEGTSVDPDPHYGARPKTKPAPPIPDLQNLPLKQNEQPEGTVSAGEDVLTEAQCIENSEATVSLELMKQIQKRSLTKIKEKYNVEIDYKTFSIKGQLENLQKFEGYLRSLHGNYTEKDSLSASDDEKMEEEEFPPIIKRKAVDKISPMKYQMFKYFFSDLHVSILQDIEVCFTGDEGCIYVQEESQEVVDKITADIRNAFTEMDKFQELDVSISEEKLELARHLIVGMNSSYSERKVYCYLYDPLNIRIVARTWDEVKAAKHQINLELGNIRITGRQKKSFSTFDDSTDNKQSSSISSESSSPDNTRKSFTTAEGIKVFVYKSSILRAPVDVIVNAANEDLIHIRGVAKVIADAAGREFIEESKQYIKKNGNLTEGATCITSGGNLDYAFVIHTVGPEWKKCSKTSEGMQKCMVDLWKAVIGCFFRAETLQVQSIALPAVSSGMYGVPMEICASQYLSAVLKYSKSTQGTSSLKEIHFIDVNEKILDLIELGFSATLGNNQAAAKQFTDRLQEVLSKFGHLSTPQTLKSIASFQKTGHSSENFEPHYVLEKNKSKFQFKAFQVLIYSGDITDSKCKAIVSSEDKDLKSQGGVAKAIRKKAGQKFDTSVANNRGRLLKVGDVIEIDGANLKCKVLCCFIPKWTNRMPDEEYKWQLGQCFRSILEKAKAYRSVAVPLIGIGVNDNNTEVCGTVLLDCLLKFSKALRGKEVIKEIHIVHLDHGHIACVTSIFTEYFDSEKKRLDSERTKSAYMGVGSATTYGGQVHLPQNSSLQSKKAKQVSKSGEHNKARVVVDMSITEKQASYNTESNQPPESQKINRGEDASQDNCAICLDTFDNPVKMKKCSHMFCKGCIDTQLQYKPVCPACGTIYGIITGNQPKGKMTERIDKYSHLEGYNGCGMIEITYNMPSGIQGDDHPKPGQHYYGLYRNAYLPNNEKGLKVLYLLHLAFDRRLIFTIGRSVTSGKDDMVTWNDIHHKTNKYGGPQKYGYPDPTYLDRVLEELAAKGVTEESEHQDTETSIAYESIVQESSV